MDLTKSEIVPDMDPTGNSFLNVSAQHKDTTQQQRGMGLHGGGSRSTIDFQYSIVVQHHNEMLH
eukprot:4028009-Ditylum_brightwellii.AAC.1